MKALIAWLLPLTVVTVIARAGVAQTGGAYDLRRNTIDGGGATFSSGGSYQVGGTIGQPDAGTLSGGVFTLGGGHAHHTATAKGVE